MEAVCLWMPVEENSMLFGPCADKSTSTAECWLPVDLLETTLQREAGCGGGKVYSLAARNRVMQRTFSRSVQCVCVCVYMTQYNDKGLSIYILSYRDEKVMYVCMCVAPTSGSSRAPCLVALWLKQCRARSRPLIWLPPTDFKITAHR